MNTEKENSSNNGCSGVRITVEQGLLNSRNNETPTKSVSRETSAGNNIVLLSNYQIAQRKRRENERSGQKILLSNKRQRINKDVPPTNSTILRATNQEEQCMQEKNLEGLSRQQTSQRKRRERERSVGNSKKQNTTPNKEWNANTLLDKTHTIGQRLRRKKEKEKEKENCFLYSMDGIIDGVSQAVEGVVDGVSQAGNQLLEETKGKQPIVEVIIYFYGSSSTGDSSREYNVIKRCPMKERTNMEGNDCITDVHPVSDSH
ncbi:hypothetical protein AQUCO_01500306v1 [Aquilegia coerulea]|uniref:Uncharacterized protein n=1 Tax=Aquilegia coerulea TaxID=218851 RepID=A0A2G5DT25_AQUCA|nr:hypothetical protein AQUCO_01500306v1 [Aquilegia coerulea]